jgi:hypothetical protein
LSPSTTFSPFAGPAAARAGHLPHRPLPGGTAHASRRRRRRHPRALPFAGVERGKARAPVMAAVATRPRGSRCIHAVHVPRATAALSSRRRLWLSPTLAARGNPVPCSPTRSRRRGGRGGGGARSCTATSKPYRRRRREARPPARRSRTCGSHARPRPLPTRVPRRRAALRPLPAPPPSSS